MRSTERGVVTDTTKNLRHRPPESADRRTIKNLRWWILGCALLAGVLNYMDRGPAGPDRDRAGIGGRR